MPEHHSAYAPSYFANAFGIGEMIRKLLFERPIDDKNSKLAENGTVIGEWIGTNKDVDMSPTSARTSISQLTMGKRAASDELRKGLMLYVEEELKDHEQYLKNRIAAELAFHLDRLQAQLAEDALGRFSSNRLFYEASMNAKLRFAIPPGYLPTGSDGRLDPDREALRLRAARVLLDQLDETDGTSGNGSKYVMCFREKKQAGEFWRNVFRQLITTYPDREENGVTSEEMCENTLNRLARLDETETIRTYVLEPNQYTLPFVVLDPDKPDAIAYSVLHDGEAIITTFIPPAFVLELRNYCLKVCRDGTSGHRVRFDEFREFLRIMFENTA